MKRLLQCLLIVSITCGVWVVFNVHMHGQTNVTTVDLKDIQGKGGGVHAFMDITVTRNGLTKPLHEFKEDLKSGDKILVRNVKNELKANLVYANKSSETVLEDDFKWGTSGKNGDPVDEVIQLKPGRRAYLLVTPWNGPDRVTIKRTVKADAKPLLDLKEDPIRADIKTSTWSAIVAEIAASTVTPQPALERAEKFAKDNGFTLPKNCLTSDSQVGSTSSDSSNATTSTKGQGAGSNKSTTTKSKKEKSKTDEKRNDPDDPKNTNLRMASCIFTGVMEQAIKKNTDEAAAEKKKGATGPPSLQSLLVDGIPIGVEIVRKQPFGGWIIAGMQAFVFATNMRKRDQSYDYVLASPVKALEFTGFAHQGKYSFGKPPYTVLVYPLTAPIPEPTMPQAAAAKSAR